MTDAIEATIDDVERQRIADAAIAQAQSQFGQFRDRIIGQDSVDPEQLAANPKNWRIHPKAQEDALESVLSAVGWVQRVIVNQRSGFVVDGHLRVALAIRRNEPSIPVAYVDLSPEEEALILTTIDPIGAMAGVDREKLSELLGDIQSDDARMLALLGDIRSRNLTLGEGGDVVSVEAVGAKISLAEQFGVPPFSVLDARQGYWQDRKRAWLALGIKSELGRGAGTWEAGETTPIERRDAMRDRAPADMTKTGAVMAAGAGGMSAGLEKKRTEAKARKVSPGGSPRPAMKTKGGKTQRGDGKGRPFAKSRPQTEDLRGGLTHRTTTDPYRTKKKAAKR